MMEKDKITFYFTASKVLIKPKSVKSQIGTSKKIETTASIDVVCYDNDCFIVGDDEIKESQTLIPESSQEIKFIDEKEVDEFGSDTEILTMEDLNEMMKIEERANMSRQSVLSNMSSYKVEDNIKEVTENLEFLKDDTTLFFINMVNKFLNDESLQFLFTDEEINLAKAFINLPSIEAKKLFVRMYWIKWIWYKPCDIIFKYLKLDYTTNKLAIEAVSLLEQMKLVEDGGNNMRLHDWLAVLNKPQLMLMCKHFKIKHMPNTKKDALTTSLKTFCSSKSTLQNFFIKGSNTTMENNVVKKMFSTYGSYIKIQKNAKFLFDRLHLIMYLGMNPSILREKRLNLLLINIKNGQQCYPVMDYKCASASCVFPTRLHFIEFERAHLLYEQVLKITSVPQSDSDAVIELCRKCCLLYKDISNNEELRIIPIWLIRFTPGYYYIKTLEIGIKSFKTKNMYEETIQILDIMLGQEIYRQHCRALWYDEKALILQNKLRLFDEAAGVLICALRETGITEDAKALLKNRALRLATQKKTNLPIEISHTLLELSAEHIETLPSIEISAKTTDSKQPGKKSQYRLTISGETTYTTVEQYALLHYTINTDYTNGEHWEGRIINSIFALLFWDIIYHPLIAASGVYLSPYQEAPLDLYTDMFYENRKDLFENRFMRIKHGWKDLSEIKEFVRTVYESRKKGEVSIFHDGIEWNSIAEIMDCLGRDKLLAICKKLATSYHYSSSGFPDLTIWNHQTKNIKFVEVKGDGDSLSFKQIQWIAYLRDSGILSEVCYVSQKNKIRRMKKTIPNKIEIPKSGKGNKRKINKTNSLPEGIEKNSPSKILKIANPDFNIEQLNDMYGACSESSGNKQESPPPKTPQQNGSFLRSPTKLSKGGIGYFVSPVKFQCSSSPTKSNSPKKHSPLSLTRRRLLDKDK